MAGQRLTILGASGGCGRWAVKHAAAQGHHVTAVVRATSPYDPPQNVTVVRGEVTDRAFIDALKLHEQTVISCLGQRRAHIFPWSKLLSPPDLVRTVAEHLLAATPRRLIWVSAGGVGPSRSRLGASVATMIRMGHVATAYADLEGAERVLERAQFPTLAVRPVTLTHGESAQSVGPVDRYRLFSTVPRRGVARWMVDQLETEVSSSNTSVLLGQVSGTPSRPET